MAESERARLGRLRRNAAYRVKHREELVEKVRRWRADNPEKSALIVARQAESARIRRQARIAAEAEARAAAKQIKKLAKIPLIKARRIAQTKKFRANNPEKCKEMQRAYQKANRERRSLLERARRARKVNAPGFHTTEDIVWLLNQQRGKCVYCRIDVRKKYTVDHIIALVSGGADDRYNLQLLCKSCNSKKYTKHPIVYAQSIGLLL